MISLPIIAFALLRTPEYMARAKLLVIGSRSYLHLSPQDSKRTTQIPETQVLNAEVENLKNRSFLLAAAQRLRGRHRRPGARGSRASATAPPRARCTPTCASRRSRSRR